MADSVSAIDRAIDDWERRRLLREGRFFRVWWLGRDHRSLWRTLFGSSDQRTKGEGETMSKAIANQLVELSRQMRDIDHEQRDLDAMRKHTKDKMRALLADGVREIGLPSMFSDRPPSPVTGPIVLPEAAAAMSPAVQAGHVGTKRDVQEAAAHTAKVRARQTELGRKLVVTLRNHLPDDRNVDNCHHHQLGAIMEALIRSVVETVLDRRNVKLAEVDAAAGRKPLVERIAALEAIVLIKTGVCGQHFLIHRDNPERSRQIPCTLPVNHLGGHYNGGHYNG